MGSAGVTGGDQFVRHYLGWTLTSDVPQVTYIQMYKWGGDWLAERRCLVFLGRAFRR